MTVQRGLLDLLSTRRLHFVTVLLFGLALNAVAALVDPLLSKVLIDTAVKREFKTFALCAVGIVVFGVAVRCAELVHDLLSQNLENAITRSLVLRVLKSYYDSEIRQDSPVMSNGYFLSRIYDEPSKIARGLTKDGMSYCISIVVFLSALGVSIYLSWRITVLLSVIVPLLYALSRRLSTVITHSSKRENEEEAKLREVLGRAIDCYKTVKIFDLFSSIFAGVLVQINLFLGTVYARTKLAKTYQMFSGVSLACAEALVMIGAAYEVVEGRLTLGGLFGFLNAFWKLISAGNDIAKQSPEVLKIKGYIDRLIEFEKPVKQEKGTGPGTGEIELDNVVVRYADKVVLDRVSLKIGKNERIIILGPNGSGKSTIANVIARFVWPSAGKVCTPPRERISALLTPFHFVPGTLKDNVKFASLSEDKKRLFFELIEEFGLQGKLDIDVASSLSEGEKRKCQVIMTLLKDADVYIFDEPLANVDVESKDRIVRRQIERSDGKTLIVIMNGDEEWWTCFDRVISTAKPVLEAKAKREQACVSSYCQVAARPDHSLPVSVGKPRPTS